MVRMSGRRGHVRTAQVTLHPPGEANDLKPERRLTAE